MSFTSLKGFDNVKDTPIFTTSQYNLVQFLDWGFLNKGAFSDVRINRSGIYGVDRSLLRRVDDPNYTAGTVYEAFTKNLVWESGLNWPTQPIAISGVWINGTFRAPNATGYEHYVDYKNGRVIFNSSRPSTDAIRMEYSYKTINVIPAEDHPIITYLQGDKYSNLNFSASSGVWSILSPAKNQTITIAVEPVNRATFRPIELGNQTQWAEVDIILHVFGTRSEVVKYTNLLGYQSDKTIMLFDLDTVAASGMSPLDYRGTTHSNSRVYPDLVSLFSNNKLYLGDATVGNVNDLGGISHGTVRFQTESIGLL